MGEWIGVDLDGTLARYYGWRGHSHIGNPVPKTVARVKRWIREGKDVRIFTARADGGPKARERIREWCRENLGKSLPVTNVKDRDMLKLLDDRAEAVVRNTGEKKAEPTPAQAAAGNYKKVHLRWNGLEFTVENVKGSTRSGVDSDGRKWSTVMPFDYGYIRGTEGKDGDHVDLFMGPDPKSFMVYVVNQKNLATGGFDEHKCMAGFHTQDEAVAAYDSAYSKGLGPRLRMGVKSMTVPVFKTWIRDRSATVKKAQQTDPSTPYQPQALGAAGTGLQGAGSWLKTRFPVPAYGGSSVGAPPVRRVPGLGSGASFYGGASAPTRVQRLANSVQSATSRVGPVVRTLWERMRPSSIPQSPVPPAAAPVPPAAAPVPPAASRPSISGPQFYSGGIRPTSLPPVPAPAPVTPTPAAVPRSFRLDPGSAARLSRFTEGLRKTLPTLDRTVSVTPGTVQRVGSLAQGAGRFLNLAGTVGGAIDAGVQAKGIVEKGYRGYVTDMAERFADRATPGRDWAAMAGTSALGVLSGKPLIWAPAMARQIHLLNGLRELQSRRNTEDVASVERLRSQMDRRSDLRRTGDVGSLFSGASANPRYKAIWERMTPEQKSRATSIARERDPGTRARLMEEQRQSLKAPPPTPPAAVQNTTQSPQAPSAPPVPRTTVQAPPAIAPVLDRVQRAPSSYIRGGILYGQPMPRQVYAEFSRREPFASDILERQGVKVAGSGNTALASRLCGEPVCDLDKYAQVRTPDLEEAKARWRMENPSALTATGAGRTEESDYLNWKYRGTELSPEAREYIAANNLPSDAFARDRALGAYWKTQVMPKQMATPALVGAVDRKPSTSSSAPQAAPVPPDPASEPQAAVPQTAPQPAAAAPVADPVEVETPPTPNSEPVPAITSPVAQVAAPYPAPGYTAPANVRTNSPRLTAPQPAPVQQPVQARAPVPAPKPFSILTLADRFPQAALPGAVTPARSQTPPKPQFDLPRNPALRPIK